MKMHISYGPQFSDSMLIEKLIRIYRGKPNKLLVLLKYRKRNN